MESDHNQCSIRVFHLLEGGVVRLYCRLVKERRHPVAVYSLFEDFQGRQWLQIEVGGRVCLEELGQESFEQRVASELLTLGMNKYSG